MTKKLAIRLAIVGLLVAGGVYAISQAQRKPADQGVADKDDDESSDKGKKKKKKRPEERLISEDNDSSDAPMPPPETIRGQDETGDPYGGRASYSLNDDDDDENVGGGQYTLSDEEADAGDGGSYVAGDRYGDTGGDTSGTGGSSYRNYGGNYGRGDDAENPKGNPDDYQYNDDRVSVASAEEDTDDVNETPRRPGTREIIEDDSTAPKLVGDGTTNSADADTYGDTGQAGGGGYNATGDSDTGSAGGYGADDTGSGYGDGRSDGAGGASGAGAANYATPRRDYNPQEDAQDGNTGAAGGYGDTGGGYGDTGGGYGDTGGADNGVTGGGYGDTGGGYGDTGGADNGVTPRTIVGGNEQNARPMPVVGTNVAIGDTPRIAPSAAQNVEKWMGIQSPALAIQKFAPQAIQVNRPAEFELRVRNDGNTTAANVIVTDQVPNGTEFLGATPKAEIINGQLVWQLGAMEPGAETRIVIQLRPIAEGEIISAAQVSFTAVAAASARSTRPDISFDVEAKESVLIQDQIDIAISIINQGTGPARNVILEGDVPVQFRHPLGPDLKNPLGTIEAGDRKVVRLTLDAVQAGLAVGQIRLKDDVGMNLAKNVQIQVIAPELIVGAKGPRIKYLEREAKYELFVANRGTAAAHKIDLVATLPNGMKYVSADKHGQYDPRTHAVYWGLEELPSNETGSVSLVLLPVEEGKQSIGIEARGELETRGDANFEVNVASVPELFFTISDTVDPVEIGTDTVYNVELTNQGTREDTNVIVEVILPEQLRPVAVEPATQTQVQGQRIVFPAIARLAPNQKLRFQVQATGVAPGDVRAAVRVMSDSTGWITKEEGTMVYGQ